MNENTGWTIFGVTFILSILLVVLLGLNYNKHRNELIAKLDDSDCFKAATISSAMPSDYMACIATKLADK